MKREIYDLLKDVKPVQVNDLPSVSVWPERLLGLEEWSIDCRDSRKILAEYDEEKYGRRLADQTLSVMMADEIRAAQFKVSPETSFAVCVEDNIFATKYDRVEQIYKKVVQYSLEKVEEPIGSLVELGGGWGYNFTILPDRLEFTELVLTDLSKNALTIAETLFERNERFRSFHFDFNDPNSYTILRDLTPPIVIFTSEAIEQVPDSRLFVSKLRELKDCISKIIHIEPLPSLYKRNFLGLMRTRYSQINSYNMDLLANIRLVDDAIVHTLDDSIFGFHPFNPLSVLVWSFSSD